MEPVHLQKKQKLYYTFAMEDQVIQESTSLQDSAPNFAQSQSKSWTDLLLELQALKELNYKLLTALNIVQDNILISEPKSGKVTFINDSCARFWNETQNQSKEELLGKPLFEKLIGSKVLETEDSTVEWNETVSISTQTTDTSTTSPLCLRTLKRVTPDGTPFLVHVVSKKQKKEPLEHYAEIIEELPVGLGIWHMEDSQSRPPLFRLIAFNKTAKDLIHPVNLPVGKTIQETLRTPNNIEIAACFASILSSGKGRAIDEFSLDGKASFAVRLFPLKHQCIGVSFEPPKKPNTLADAYFHTFEYNPHTCVLYQVRPSESGKPSLFWVTSNLTGRKTRKGNWAPQVGMTLPQIAPVFANYPNVEAAVCNLEVGKEMKFLSSHFTNPRYVGSMNLGRVIRLPNNYVLMLAESLSAETAKHYQLIVDVLSQKLSTTPEELKEYCIIADRLESISATLQCHQSIPIPITPNIQQTTTYQQPHYEYLFKSSIPSLVQITPMHSNLEVFRRGFYESNIGQLIVSPQGVILAVNTAFARTLGASTEDFISNSFIPITHPDDVEKSVNLFRQMVAGEIHSFQLVKRYVHKQGHAVYCLVSTTLVRSNGIPSYFISQVQEASHVKSLISSDDSGTIYFSAFKNSPFATCIISKDGTLYNVNSIFCERLGFVGHELLGKQFHSLFREEDQDNIITVVQWMMDGKATTKQMLYRLETKSKTHLWAFLNFFAITDTKQSTTHVACILSDSS